VQAVTTIGLDIAKSVFQVHSFDAEGKVVARQPLRRARVLPFVRKLRPCVVGMEACASSHHWSRELQTLGHTVRLGVLSFFVNGLVGVRLERSWLRRLVLVAATC
jgi:transposase